jgi:hypothetical protein
MKLPAWRPRNRADLNGGARSGAAIAQLRL